MKGALIRILGAAALLLPSSAIAQTAPNGRIPVTQVVDQNGNLVAFANSGSNASVGANDAAVPSSSTLVAGRSAAGNSKPLLTDSNGALAPSVAGTANRVITKTSLAANTSTSVCPTATAPLTTEIQVQTGTVGLGINGQALSSAAYGVATTNPDLVIGAAGTLYVFPVAPTNAVTAYTATAQVVVCIQTLRP